MSSRLRAAGVQSCHSSTLVHTLPYRFARVAKATHCHAPWLGGTQGARFGETHLGRAPARQGPEPRAPRGRVVALGLGPVAALRETLGPGGAAVDTLAIESVRRDCQVPVRRKCLSLRAGAAGPERSRAPRALSLALGQPLEQRHSVYFTPLQVFLTAAAEPLCSYSRPQRARQGERVFRYGTAGSERRRASEARR